jgi:hypothetical protein
VVLRTVKTGEKPQVSGRRSAESVVLILHGFRASSPIVTDMGCCPSAADLGRVFGARDVRSRPGRHSHWAGTSRGRGAARPQDALRVIDAIGASAIPGIAAQRRLRQDFLAVRFGRITMLHLPTHVNAQSTQSVHDHMQRRRAIVEAKDRPGNSSTSTPGSESPRAHSSGVHRSWVGA